MHQRGVVAERTLLHHVVVLQRAEQAGLRERLRRVGQPRGEGVQHPSAALHLAAVQTVAAGDADGGAEEECAPNAAADVGEVPQAARADGGAETYKRDPQEAGGDRRLPGEEEGDLREDGGGGGGAKEVIWKGAGVGRSVGDVETV